MATGLHTANLANKWLDMLRGVAFAAPAGLYMKLHTGDPGAAGTANASGTTTRMAITLSAASGGSISMSGTLSWTSWAAGTETISHVSLWDNVSAGIVLWTGALASSKTVNNGDTLNITAMTAALSPLMA